MLVQLLDLFITLITLTILARIILTLVLSFMANDPPPGLVNITRVLVQVTEPILAPIRRLLPNTGMLDFSPMVVILILVVISWAIRNVQ